MPDLAAAIAADRSSRQPRSPAVSSDGPCLRFYVCELRCATMNYDGRHDSCRPGRHTTAQTVRRRAKDGTPKALGSPAALAPSSPVDLWAMRPTVRCRSGRSRLVLRHGSLDAFDCGTAVSTTGTARRSGDLCSVSRESDRPATRTSGQLFGRTGSGEPGDRTHTGQFVVPTLLQLYARELPESDGDPEGSVARESSSSRASSSATLASHLATKGQSAGLSRAAGAVGDFSTQTGPFKDVAGKLGGKSLDSFPDLTRRLPTRVDRDALGI